MFFSIQEISPWKKRIRKPQKIPYQVANFVVAVNVVFFMRNQADFPFLLGLIFN